MVLARADSVAWFTAGGDLGQDLGSEPGSVALFINRTSRAVITDNVQSARVFEEELAGLGFQLKERPWHRRPVRGSSPSSATTSGSRPTAMPPGLAVELDAAQGPPPAADDAGAAAAPRAGPDADPGRRGDLPELHARARPRPTSPATWPIA